MTNKIQIDNIKFEKIVGNKTYYYNESMQLVKSEDDLGNCIEYYYDTNNKRKVLRKYLNTDYIEKIVREIAKVSK